MRIFLAVAVLISAPALTRGQPPRDTSARPHAGTATIRGRVVAGDTGKPLRRARIIATAPELMGEPRNTSTDADGRYELTGLPAGSYSLRVSRSGYLMLGYGQRRPLEQPRPLQVPDAATVDHVDFVLPRMGLITGRIFDDTNEPIEGVNVYALREMYFNGRRQFVPTGAAQVRTDDAGQYRLLGLQPGAYMVKAMTRETWNVTTSAATQTMGYVPTYFPGTASAAQARKVTVRLGQESSNTDFALLTGRAATISGRSVDSHGRPFQTVILAQEIRGENFGSSGTVATASVAADGSFTIRDVPPGEYVLGSMTGRDSADPEVAMLPLAVDGPDIDNVVLTGSGGGTVSGQLLTEEGTIPAIPRLRVRVAEFSTGQPSPLVVGAFRNAGGSEVDDAGTFTVNGVFGRSRLRLLGLPDTWAVKAVLHEGRDIAEAPIELRNGESLTGVQIVLTQKITSVGGMLVDAKNAPTTEGTVIVFSTNAEKWTDGSRYVRAARPDQQGQWHVNGMPPGEYYAVAFDAVEQDQWYEAEYLNAIQRYAQRVVVASGEARTINLKLTVADQP